MFGIPFASMEAMVEGINGPARCWSEAPELALVRVSDEPPADPLLSEPFDPVRSLK